MNRRKFLAGAGFSLSTALAGCLETVGIRDEANPKDGAGDAPESVHGTEPPSASYPDYGDNVVQTVGYDTIDPDETDIYLEPSTQTVNRSETVTFTLTNGSDETLTTNFYDWRIHKWVDEEWYRIAPQMTPLPAMGLNPGDEHTWTVTSDNEGIEDGKSVPSVSGTEDLVIPGLGSGHYAFGVDGSFEGESYEEKTAFVARFELDADPLPLTPTNAIQETEWEDDTLVIQSNRGDPDNDDHRLGTYELTHVDEPTADARRVLTEQVMRNNQLRDTLALALKHDSDRVRLEEYNGVWPIFGVQDTESYEYQGEYYDVSIQTYDT